MYSLHISLIDLSFIFSTLRRQLPLLRDFNRRHSPSSSGIRGPLFNSTMVSGWYECVIFDLSRFRIDPLRPRSLRLRHLLGWIGVLPLFLGPERDVGKMGSEGKIRRKPVLVDVRSTVTLDPFRRTFVVRVRVELCMGVETQCHVSSDSHFSIRRSQPSKGKLKETKKRGTAK